MVAGALTRRPAVALSVSATTRAPRPGEVEGVHYLFLDDERFSQIERQGGFIEHALVHGNRYGTPRAAVQQALDEGKTVVLEIDVQGAEQVRASMPEAVTVFVRPPAPEVLRERLRGRGTEEEPVVERRLANAMGELAKAETFDHQIVNDDLEKAISQLIRILDGSEHPDPGPPAPAEPGPEENR